MSLRYDVNLVRHSSRERDISDKFLIFRYDTIALMDRNEHRSVGIIDLIFIIEDLIQLTAPDATFSVDKMFLGVYQFALKRVRNNGSRNNLRVRMSQRSAGRLAVI